MYNLARNIKIKPWCFNQSFSIRMLATQPRIRMLTPNELNPDQKVLYDRVVKARAAVGAKGGFSIVNENGALNGPWNAQVMSPKIGGLFEQLGSAVRNENSLPARLYEIGILVIGA